MKKTLLLTLLLAMLTSLNIMAGDEMKYTPQATTFNVVTLGNAKGVTLRLYSDGLAGQPIQTVEMKSKRMKDGNRLWTAVVKGDQKGKFYTFDVLNADGRYLGETQGIWAKAVAVNGRRAAVLDMRETDPVGWNADVCPTIDARDLVLYELHHRDFSIDSSSGIINKGKFLALTEPRAIEHLKKLGINAVHILPSFDYASVDETRLSDNQYNWGYDPVNYNVPEGGYSTDPYRPEVRIREFKQMVQALHSAGIKVILDVVYNHVFDIGASCFQHTMPDYFFRKNADGSYGNGSGCGNETASERPLMRQYIVESTKYWADEYHIDGFRFDLMGVHDIATMNAIRKALPEDIFIYGEGWAAGGCVLPNEQLGMKSNVAQMPGIAAFSDDIRDALRGPWDGDDKSAFLGRQRGFEESIKFGIVGGVQHPQVDITKVNYSNANWATQPTQMIAYVSCHDDMCLVDRLKASIPGITLDEVIRLDLLAQTVVMTSQGVPFLLSGEEMLRTKLGVHNSYNSPDSINHLDWKNLERYPQVMDYYSRLIAMRKAHPAFHMGDADLVRKHVQFLDGGNGLVAFAITDAKEVGDDWNNIYVAFNANREVRLIDVPKGNYTVVCSGGMINACCGLGTINGGKVSVPAQCALIIHD